MVSETHEFQSRKKIAGAAPHAAKEAARTAKAEDVITVLEERGLTVSGEERERIIRSADARQLDTWLRRAVTADRASDLFID
jgi:acetylglutamate kinase